jgi:hypothetical protein
MFWTIVGALLFVFVGIPIILSLLGLTGYLSLNFLLNRQERESQTKKEIKNPSNKLIIAAITCLIFMLVSVGFILLAKYEHNTSDQLISKTNVMPTAPLARLQTSSQDGANLRRQAQAEKTQNIIDGLMKKYPDKTINYNEEFNIMNNLPADISYERVKDALLEKGYEFVGYENDYLSSNTEKTTEMKKIVNKIVNQNPEKIITAQESSEIQKNLPSNIFYFEIKDELLKLGFKFESYY